MESFCNSLLPALRVALGAWPIPSPRLLALLAFWALSSYVIGRYVSGAQRVSGSRAWILLVSS